jgi:hypothetical protein
MKSKLIRGALIVLVIGGYFLYHEWNKLRVVVPEYTAPPEQKVQT